MELRVATFLSPNYFSLYRFVAETISRNIEATRLDFSQGNTFEEFQNREFDLAFACGYWYAHKTENYTPLAAPILLDRRYGNAASYFVDIITRADSNLKDFSDLSGRVFAYNEEFSFSGFQALRAELSHQGLTFAIFGKHLKTGSHLGSIEAVLKGEADFAALDSTVLAYEYRLNPTLQSRLKVITSFGPYPAPPLLVNKNITETTRQKIKKAVENLPAAELAQFGLNSYQPVSSADYTGFTKLVSC